MSKKKIEHTLFDGDRLVKKQLPLKKINTACEKCGIKKNKGKTNEN